MIVQKTVLILHTFAMGSFWSSQIERGLKLELERSGYRGNFETIYLPSSSTKEVLQRVDQKKPDCVVITNEPAASELFDEIAGSRKIPTFFASIPKRESQLSWVGKNRNYITGVLEKTHIPKTISTLEKITGKKVGKLGVLASGPTENILNLAKLIEFEVREARPDIQISIERAITYEDWQGKYVRLDQQNDAIVPLLPFGMKSDKGGADIDWSLINVFIIRDRDF